MQIALRYAPTLLLALGPALGAQATGYSSGGTTLSPQVAASYLEASARDAAVESRWLRVVVLWRGQSDWSRGGGGFDGAKMRAASGQYNTARRTASGRDGMLLGGLRGSVSYTAELDSTRTALTVLEQRFSVPHGDSALVVMVDRIDGVGGDPVIAGAKVVESRLPDGPAEQTWTHGDTTFTVHARGRDDRTDIETVLGRDPVVAAFMARDVIGGPTDVLVRAAPRATLTSLAEFQPDLAAVEGPFECTGREAIGQTATGRRVLESDAVSYTAAFPSKAASRATVVVIVDFMGTMLRYSERRGPPIRPAVNPGNSDSEASGNALAAAVAAVRSMTITLDYRGGRGTVANAGGGKPDQLASAPIDSIGPMDRFGKPFERAERVLAQCAGKR